MCGPTAPIFSSPITSSRTTTTRPDLARTSARSILLILQTQTALVPSSSSARRSARSAGTNFSIPRPSPWGLCITFRSRLPRSMRRKTLSWLLANVPSWAVEVLYYMDLGFLPPDMQFFAISGRAGWYGPKGDQNAPLVGTGVGFNSTATKTELNSEPIRLTFDASKAVYGAKYTHFVYVWVAWRYWQNKFGLDHNAAPFVCTVNGVSTNSCTESSVYTGMTVKF